MYPRLVGLGIDAVAYARTGYVQQKPYDFRGVHVLPLASIRSPNLETIAHTCMAIFHCARHGAKLMHLHAIGPAIWTPLAKRLGMKVIVTHHGFDYRRQKWGNNAKAMLKRGEAMAIKHADGLICISSEILENVTSRSPAGLVAKIPNGVERPTSIPSDEELKRWGLRSGGYLLITARFVAEKGIPDLIRAWDASGLKGTCELVVAGGEDHPSKLGDEIRGLAAEAGATMTGIVTGNVLNTLYAHARGFVLPSYHEGLPISLLEAMSWNLPCVASSIRANLEVGLDGDSYFTAGRIDDLSERMKALVAGPARVDHSLRLKPFDWDAIASDTADFYGKVVGKVARAA
ncbi:MAG: glycosyltransferase family 4 protein [Fibrobacterota bacterium]|nr:glycosyltransferase family 4 protein [Fibrobacterota bacterium]QQS03790.1 MAG: glycosyltransferase family 4 protein [Fibrobacterota bacterium]